MSITFIEITYADLCYSPISNIEENMFILVTKSNYKGYIN